MADVRATLRDASRMLQHSSATPRLDAELLMAHALGVSRSDMLLRHQQATAPACFADLLRRRMAHEPVAYILGRQEFFGLDFKVTPAVLIPRSDSETIVRAALDAAPTARRVLDLGTGSGALLLAVLSQLPGARGIGVDASATALAVARANAASLGLAGRATMRPGNWTQAGWSDGLGRFDLVLANPPYVEDGARLDPDVRDFEPASALFAGPDGLDDYRVLIPQLAQLLADQGVAVIEIGASQADSVSEIARQHGFTVAVHKDLGQRDRALELRLTLGKGESSS